MACGQCKDQHDKAKHGVSAMIDNTDRLDGWGEILAHLGLGDYRTVLARGYPVRTFRQTGKVFALKSELRAHEGDQPVRAPVTSEYSPVTPIAKH